MDQNIKPLALIKPKDKRHMYQGNPSTDFKVGLTILIITWLIFIVGVGGILDFWEIPNTIFHHVVYGQLDEYGELDEYGDSIDDFPMKNYYVVALLLIPVGFWIWTVASWTALKLFKHAKGANLKGNGIPMC